MSSTRHDWKDGDRAMVILEDVTIGGAHAKGQRKDMDAWLPFACFHKMPADDMQQPRMQEMIDPKSVKPGDMLAALAMRAARLAAPTAPAIDPHAALKDAVVEAALAWIERYGNDVRHDVGVRLRDAVSALKAARTPPDPWEELRDAAMAVLAIIERGGIPTPALAAGLRAAVEAMRRGA